MKIDRLVFSQRLLLPSITGSLFPSIEHVFSSVDHRSSPLVDRAHAASSPPVRSSTFSPPSIAGPLLPSIEHVVCFFNRAENRRGTRERGDVIGRALIPCGKETDAFLQEHGEKIHETFVGGNDIDLKRDSKCFREQHSVFASKDSICHDKVSSFLCELEPCNTCHGNSQPTLRCLETPQMSEGGPSSSSTKSFFNGSWENSQNTKACPISFITSNLVNPSLGYHAKRILHSSRQKAIRMVDVAMKVMSSMKVGEDAYAMIGRALDSAEIQQFGSPYKILRTQHCFNPQNGIPENCHHDFSCNPAEIAATVHLINSTVPTLTQNVSQVPPKLISACVAALLMIQVCSSALSKGYFIVRKLV
ncbi:hypothetical protein KSP39_PZI013683 [Platanthera zijinensis]|uniref:Uncharacterized protein n=1 Tax=Platanthera zijinensis TaxID=2320716 RepID=A0AAP0G3F9_9ASPA